MTTQEKCLFVAMLGLPNSGKSTLTNALVGKKVSIVTRKPQTTRFQVSGVFTKDKTQVVFLDTPGVFSAKESLDKEMVTAAFEAARNADNTLFIVDASKEEDHERILNFLKHKKVKATLVLNKIDKVRKEKLLAISASFYKTSLFENVFMVSAKTLQGTSDLKESLFSSAKECPWFYPEEEISNLSDQVFAAEITREKVFTNLHQELPYGVHVETELFENFKNGDLRIIQYIFIEKESHKRMILGEKGALIKKIGQSARNELEKVWGCKVHLFLHVKIDSQWKHRKNIYVPQN